MGGLHKRDEAILPRETERRASRRKPDVPDIGNERSPGPSARRAYASTLACSLSFNSMTDPRPTPDWRPLALMLALVTAAYVFVYRLSPHDTKAYYLWPFGAFALYSGARLTARVAFPLTLAVFALTDLILYQVEHKSPNYVFY